MKINVHFLRLGLFIQGLSAGLCSLPCRAAERGLPPAGLAPVELRCEFQVNPLGIEEIQPRLSWQLVSAERGARQVACQILVSSTPELLQQDKGDLWDSGRLESDESIGTVYAGSPLVSQEHCFWKVRAWDAQNHAVWSEPAEWSMGLLASTDWQAPWIGYDAARTNAQPVSPFAHAQWIWFAPDGDKPPKGVRLFSRDFSLPVGGTISRAELTATADDGFQFAINNQIVLANPPGNESWRHPQQTDVTTALQPGVNHLSVLAENADAGAAGLAGRDHWGWANHSPGDGWFLARRLEYGNQLAEPAAGGGCLVASAGYWGIWRGSVGNS